MEQVILLFIITYDDLQFIIHNLKRESKNV